MNKKVILISGLLAVSAFINNGYSANSDQYKINDQLCYECPEIPVLNTSDAVIEFITSKIKSDNSIRRDATLSALLTYITVDVIQYLSIDELKKLQQDVKKFSPNNFFPLQMDDDWIYFDSPNGLDTCIASIIANIDELINFNRKIDTPTPFDIPTSFNLLKEFCAPLSNHKEISFVRLSYINQQYLCKMPTSDRSSFIDYLDSAIEKLGKSTIYDKLRDEISRIKGEINIPNTGK